MRKPYIPFHEFDINSCFTRPCRVENSIKKIFPDSGVISAPPLAYDRVIRSRWVFNLLTSVLGQCPHCEIAASWLSWGELHRGMFARAIAHSTMALERTDDAIALLVQGTALLYQGRTQEAFDVLHHLASLDPVKVCLSLHNVSMLMLPPKPVMKGDPRIGMVFLAIAQRLDTLFHCHAFSGPLTNRIETFHQAARKNEDMELSRTEKIVAMLRGVK